MCKYLFLSTFFSFFIIETTFAQVDLPTGRAVVSYPLYTYVNGGKLAVSVNLEYTGGNGIKVSEIASNVGLGWSLQAGGIITRTTIGEPDDQVGGRLEGDMFATGRAFSSYSNTPMPAKGAWVPLQNYRVPFYRHDANVIDDREMDVFTYTYNGRQGSFVIGTTGTIKTLDNAQLKIEKVSEDLSASGILTRWSKFIITDESGVKYTFSEKVLDRIILYETGGQKRFYLDPAPANLQTYVCRQNYKITNYSVVNSWYLSEVSDPLTNKKITYTYEDYELEYIAEEQGSYTVSPLDGNQDQIVAQRITPRYKGIMKRLLSINLPDNNQVQFNYHSTNRADLTGDKALQRIAIKKDGIETMGYLFDYQYFSVTNIRDFNYGFTATEAEKARLCLKSFRKYGKNGVADNPYVFTYNTGTSSRGVPGRNTPAIDHYGYYNGNNVDAYDTDIHIYENIRKLCIANRRPVVPTITIIGSGTLTSIKYPTGGSFTYEYESNTALNGTATVYTGGIRVSKTIQSDGINANSNIIKEYKYVLENGQTSGWGYEEPQYLETTSSRLVVPTKGSFVAANVAYSLGMSALQSLFTAYAHSNPTGVSKYPAKTSAASSTGSSLATNIVTTLAAITITYIIRDIFSSDVQDVSTTSTANLSAHPKNQNPLPALYSRVEVYEGSSTDNIGRTVYEFTSDKDFAINVPALVLGTNKQRCIPWLYGLMKRQKVFNKANEPIQEVYNKYTADIRTYQTVDFVSTFYKPYWYIIIPVDKFPDYSSSISFAVDKYYPIAGNALLTYTITKKFTGPDYQMKRSDYEYDPVYYNLKKVSILNSQNEKEEKRIYYPYDYNNTGIMKTMTDNHIFNTSISSETWLYKSGTEEQLIGVEVTDFQQVASGDIKPGKTYLLASNVLLPKSIIGTFNPASLVRNSTYFKEAANYTYNAAGYLSTTTTLDRQTSYLYSDNNEQIIAQTVNAGSTDIGYSSFEPGAKGTWVVTPKGSATTNITVTPVPSGDYCLNMTNVQSIQKAGLNSNKKYILSFWKKDGTITVTGGTKTDEKNVVVRNGWTLVTMYVTQVTAMTITGDGLLDELRLYPVSSLLTSTTYNAQSNITSSVAADNMATYYSYDELGRITATYDSDRNLINSTQYKYGQ